MYENIEEGFSLYMCSQRFLGFLTDREQRKVWGVNILYLLGFPILCCMILIGALNDDAADVRAEASTLLGKLHEATWAEPLLSPKLSDPVAQVRKNAALALMKLEAVGATPLLQQLAESESDPGVQAVFRLAINQLNPDDQG